MLCDRCKNNNATVHIVKIINGEKKEINLCEDCARQSNETGINNYTNFINPFSFQNVLSGLVDYINQSNQIHKTVEEYCTVCGTTYSEFKKNGIIGCEECYSYFSSILLPVIKRVQGNTEHIGKIPLRIGNEIMDKRKIIKLKEELKNAVSLEEYEKAAQLRDEIRKIQNGEGRDNNE